MDSYNFSQQEIVNKNPIHRHYIDVNPSIQEQLECFTCDGTHLTMFGYKSFSSIIKPTLEEIWKKAKDP